MPPASGNPRVLPVNVSDHIPIEIPCFSLITPGFRLRNVLLLFDGVLYKRLHSGICQLFVSLFMDVRSFSGRDPAALFVIIPRGQRASAISHTSRRSQQIAFIRHLTGIPVYHNMDAVPEAAHRDLNMVDHRDFADDRPGCDDRFCLGIDHCSGCVPVPA
jgi:hypothetical protein